MGGISDMIDNLRADKRKAKTAVARAPTEIELLQRENRTLKLQNARLAAERVMLQELARSLQNMNQNQMTMLGDVINNASGLLTDESVADSVRLLASTVKQVRPTAVEDVITRIALLDDRTQGVIAAPEKQLVDAARLVREVSR